jgi:hypothetical protein
MRRTFELAGFDEGGEQGPPGHRRLVCLIKGGGKLAIWGREGATRNIEKVLSAGPYCTVECEVGPPGTVQAQKFGHTHWVESDHDLRVVSAEAKAVAPRVTPAELDAWRRAVVQLVVSVDTDRSDPAEGISSRITKLTHRGVIPREIASLMRVVTEMRNTSLYEAKVLSPSETSAVHGAWAAVQEWAHARGLKLGSG